MVRARVTLRVEVMVSLVTVGFRISRRVKTRTSGLTIHQTTVYHTADIYAHTLLTPVYRAAHVYMLHSQTACYPKTPSLRRRVTPVSKAVRVSSYCEENGRGHHGSLHDQWHGLAFRVFAADGPSLLSAFLRNASLKIIYQTENTHDQSL